jgi:hypothetical protein
MSVTGVLDTYGIELRSNVRLTQLDYELAAYSLCRESRLDGIEFPEGLLGDAAHFINAAKILWPEDSTLKPFVWTPQAKRLLKKYCKERVLGVTGHGSSSKTALSAIWALINVFARPREVMCIVVSTDVEGAAQGRIYAQIQDFFFAIEGRMSFRLNKASHSLAPYDPNRLFKFSPSAGIKLVSGNANKEREAAGKIKGYKIGGLHPGTIILIIDEGTDVAAGIYTTFYENMMSNPKAQLIALANYKDNNAFADLVEPEEGWATISPDDQFWRTARGACVHLDGLQSPNWLHHLRFPLVQENLYPFLQDWKHVQGFIDRGEDDSPGWWEQIRAFKPPVGTGDVGCYDPAELTMYGADRPMLEAEWATTPVPFAGCDPSFSEGGDKAMFVPGRFGFHVDGTFVIEFLKEIPIPIKAGEGNDAVEYQILQFMKDWRDEWKVDERLIGYDSTNPSFKTLVQSNGGKGFFPCPFHGASTDRVVAEYRPHEKPLKNSDIYGNRVSEIWGVGVDFMRKKQLRGIRGAIKTEATIRRWKLQDSINRGRRLKSVESKKEMKKRIRGRKSPDSADAAFIGLDTVISYLRLRVGGKPYDAADAAKKREEALRKGHITPRHLGQRGGVGRLGELFAPPPKRTPDMEVDALFKAPKKTFTLKPGQRFL